MSAVPLPTFAPAPSPAERKRALEDLLRARRLQADAPPLRGEDRRLRPLATGIAEVDALLEGRLPARRALRDPRPRVLGPHRRPPRAPRTGRRAAGRSPPSWTRSTASTPSSAAAAGAELSRLLWLRGPRVASEEPSPKTLADATAAVATLASSGLFDVVALDLAGASRERRRLPSTTWLRLQRLVEDTTTAVVLVAEEHVACGPGGAALALEPVALRWSGPPGPARLLAALAARARAGRHGLRSADFALAAL